MAHADMTTQLEDYAKIISDEYNRYVELYYQSIESRDWTGESAYAFLLNGIVNRITASKHDEVRHYFYTHTPTESTYYDPAF